MSDRLSRAVTPDESRGLLDTSVVIDIDVIDSALLPDETVISAITLAELGKPRMSTATTPGVIHGTCNDSTACPSEAESRSRPQPDSTRETEREAVARWAKWSCPDLVDT